MNTVNTVQRGTWECVTVSRWTLNVIARDTEVKMFSSSWSVGCYTTADAITDRYQDEQKSDELLLATRQMMVEQERMLDKAIKFVDRMKLMWLIDTGNKTKLYDDEWSTDSAEGFYINYIYNMLIEWTMIENLTEADVRNQTRTASDWVSQWATSRLELLSNLRETEKEVELIKKAWRPTYFVGGNDDEEVGDVRKIFMTQDPETWVNEVYEVWYGVDNRDDMRDPIERNEVDLSKVIFKCKEAA